MKIEKMFRYETFIVVGVLMTFGTLIKLMGILEFSSDWFWLLAGVGLIVEGSISHAKQKRFECKYKIITKEEYEKLVRKK